jgi:hypothetical protein
MLHTEQQYTEYVSALHINSKFIQQHTFII